MNIKKIIGECMNKGFKLFLLGATTACLSLSMILPANLYSVKAESTRKGRRYRRRNKGCRRARISS